MKTIIYTCPYVPAEWICADVRRFGAEAVLISRILGAGHCAFEGEIISEIVQAELDVPVLEIEVPSVTDSMRPTLRTRLEALVETVKARPRGRQKKRRRE